MDATWECLPLTSMSTDGPNTLYTFVVPSLPGLPGSCSGWNLSLSDIILRISLDINPEYFIMASTLILPHFAGGPPGMSPWTALCATLAWDGFTLNARCVTDVPTYTSVTSSLSYAATCASGSAVVVINGYLSCASPIPSLPGKWARTSLLIGMTYVQFPVTLHSIPGFS